MKKLTLPVLPKLKKRDLILRLEYDGKCLYEMRSSELKEELIIGHSAECIWRVPASERCVSGRHARIYRKGGRLYFEDLKSRNGSFLFGKRVGNCKISNEDIFGLGDCKLYAYYERKESPSGFQGYPYHRFEQLTGEDKGKLIDLKEDVIRIGSAGDCQLLLADPMVSHIHAILENHPDGTCWIKDQGSKNKTQVNKMPLDNVTSSSGRMLKDNDIVSIAYLDFRFWDKNVQHIRSHGMLKLVAALLTVAIVLLGWFMYKTIMPSAKDYYLDAEKVAARKKFEVALTYLTKAKEARGKELLADKLAELEHSIELWAVTVQTWDDIKDFLQKEKWGDAKHAFAIIVTSSQDNWHWNSDDALAQMRIAQATQQLLDYFLECKELLENSSDNFEYLGELSGKLSGAIQNCSVQSLDFQANLLQQAQATCAEVQELLKEYQSLATALQEFREPSQTQEVLNQLEARRKQLFMHNQQLRSKGIPCSEALVTYCDHLLEPVRYLANSYQTFLQNIENVAGMKFDQIETTLPLPPLSQCMVHPSFGPVRGKLLEMNDAIPQTVVYLKNFKTRFNASGLGPEQKNDILFALFNEEKMEKALSCDSLALPPPSYSDPHPAGEYDQMFGIYVYYLYLTDIESNFDASVLDERFEPTLFAARKQFALLQSYTDFYFKKQTPGISTVMEYVRKVPAEKNMLERYAHHANALLKQRTSFLKQIYTRYAGENVLRRKLMLGGIVHWLAVKEDRFVSEELTAELALTVKALKNELRQYTQRTDERVIQFNEQKLLELGLPGDPLLRQPWTDRFKEKKQ